MKSIVSQTSRHIVLRFEEGESFPEAILDALREHGIAAGWIRASGIVSEAEIKAFRSDHRAYGTSRRIAGPLHVALLEGSIGMARGEPSVGLRTIVARETESGLETISGELTSARVVAVEAVITALDDIACARALDDRTSTWLLDPDPSATPAPTRNAAPVRERVPPPEPPQAWAQAVAASPPERDRPITNEPMRAPIPQRPQ
ncbi:MAG: PPC domain-containing DNA-binding protein, partial [Polyangiaceae bacterium]